MDALKAIMTRRSVRKFDVKKPISKDVVEKILHAGMSAPSAVNQQPWHFLVIDERALLDKLATVHPHAAMCLQASLAIILCVDESMGPYRPFWVEDMSAATQNVLLAVRACELGAVWVGVYPNCERVHGLQKLFDLPKSVVPFSLIPIGYTDVAQHEVLERIKKERVHHNKW